MICGCGYEWQSDCMRCTRPEQRSGAYREVATLDGLSAALDVRLGAVGASDDHVTVPAGANGPAGPTITVTEEMIEAGRVAHYRSINHDWNETTYESVYRSMAALAPKPDENFGLWTSIAMQYKARIAELESYSHELAQNLDERNAKDQEKEAYQYLKRLFLHLAPQCCVLPDLIGVCTQIDNLIVGLIADNAALCENLDILDEEIVGLKAKLATFGDPAPADLPKPTLRPDGTRAPEPKPLPVLKTHGPSRRIGG